MKKSNKLIIVLLLILTGAVAFAAVAAEIIYQTSGLSELKLTRSEDDMRWVSTTLQNYELYRDFESEMDSLYLVESRVNRQSPLDAEGITGTAQWTVRSGARLENSLWNRSEQATRLFVDHSWGLVISSLGGCCAQIDGYRAFNIKTGKLILSYNDFSYDDAMEIPYVLSVPNSPLEPRFIGVISGDSTRDLDFVDPVAGTNAAALIKYASRDSAIFQKLQMDILVAPGWGISVLDAKLEKDPAVLDSGKIEISRSVATLWNIDKQTDPMKIEGVRLVLVVNAGNGDKTIKIPVRKDRLSLEAAEIPEGVHIRVL
ncbi:hypothetical protein [Bdellovibrio sp. HCB2-146]|uniref:hypothetical protein n=1 Tax=Bdellovibrio sp. HCB2-146 TaxID=3394362 RepID=UPI0039BD8C26